MFSGKIFLIRLFIGVVCGGLAGYFIGTPMVVLAPVGKAFVYILKILVDPIIFTSIILGVTGLPNIKKLGSLGIKTFAYFMITTLIAVAHWFITGKLYRTR